MNKKINNVYIVEPVDQGWIIERLMRDISAELNTQGIPTRIGPAVGYQGEEIIFNSRFLQPLFNSRAKINSLFITHVDDKIKELELKHIFNLYNSFVCMSPQDAHYVSALKGGKNGVIGIDLPTRDQKVRPIRLALFSACYEDGRKNETWIAEYFRDKPSTYKNNFIFSFMGWGWEKYSATLGEMEMNYEIYRYSRFLPGEYELYKEKLPLMDVLIYLGFDGGAMSVYDGISAGIDIIASNISYHQGLGPSVKLFDNKEGFFMELDRLHAKNTERKEMLLQRSIVSYTNQLVSHWNSLLTGELLDNEYNTKSPLGATELKTLGVYQRHYKRIGFSRVRSFLIRLIKKK